VVLAGERETRGGVAPSLGGRTASAGSGRSRVEAFFLGGACRQHRRLGPSRWAYPYGPRSSERWGDGRKLTKAEKPNVVAADESAAEGALKTRDGSAMEVA